MDPVQFLRPDSPAPGPRSPAPVSWPALLVLAVVALSFACAAPRRLLVTSSGAHSVADLLETYRPDPEKNVTVFELDRSAYSSRHLAFVRDREQPHTHPKSDIIVTLLRGHGTIWVDGQPVAVATGDETVVDAGTPHYFVNESDEPSAAFVIYAPPSDGGPPQPVGSGPQ